MSKTIAHLQKISAQSSQNIPILQSTGNVRIVKVITHLQKTINLCQKAIAQERRNAYQLRRSIMISRRPI